MDRQMTKARRMRKAREILKDVPEGIQDGMAGFLDAVDDMADETQTYPVGDQILDLDELDDDEFDELRDAHEGLGKAFDKWAGVVDRLGGE